MQEWLLIFMVMCSYIYVSTTWAEEEVSIEGTLLMLDDATPHVAVPVQAIRDGRVIAITLSDESGQYRHSSWKNRRRKMSKEMARVQVYVGPELRKKIEALASQRNISISELIRQSIRRFFQEEKASEQEPLLGIVGLGRSAIGDVSEKHDQYLAEEK